MNKPLVLLLRRDAASLKTEELNQLAAMFPDGFEMKRIDPADYIEHDKICADLQPAFVVLPMERPIPSLAMEHGFAHVVFSPHGLMELEPLVPKFKPLERVRLTATK